MSGTGPHRRYAGCKSGRPIVSDFSAADLARFSARIITVGECSLFGSPESDDYVDFTFKGKTVRAHRFAYTVSVGPIPPGAVVSHACDRRNCVNPDHLRVTGQRTNMVDAYRKGRIRALPRGATHPMAKLTEDQIAQIRARAARGEPQRALAREFGVLQPAISKIVNFRRHRPAVGHRRILGVQPHTVRDDWRGTILHALSYGLEAMGFGDAEILEQMAQVEEILDRDAERMAV